MLSEYIVYTAHGSQVLSPKNLIFSIKFRAHYESKLELSDAVLSALERRLSCITHAESTPYVQINTEQLSQREDTGSEPRWAPLELLKRTRGRAETFLCSTKAQLG
ncbi:unnamed protein product [Coccothraustes coccothraustes]